MTANYEATVWFFVIVVTMTITLVALFTMKREK